MLTTSRSATADRCSTGVGAPGAAALHASPARSVSIWTNYAYRNVSGAIGVGGSVVGILLSDRTGRANERRRLSAEDERRWLQERRVSYAGYLELCLDMLRELDGIGVMPSYDGSEPIDDDGEEIIRDGLVEYFHRWETKLQAALADVQLIASPRVADLADRVSAGLAEATGPIEHREPFTSYYPVWFQTRDLVGVLRNAMRDEIGVQPGPKAGLPGDPDWPWLPDPPSRESYVQDHSRHLDPDG